MLLSFAYIPPALQLPQSSAHSGARRAVRRINEKWWRLSRLKFSIMLSAAPALPLRRRIQSGIDRRKYIVTKIMESFADAARDEIDLEKLRAELLHVNH